MSVLLDSLRAYWLPDIANTKSSLDFSTSEWVKRGGFYVSTVSSTTSFSLQIASVADVNDLFAATANRPFTGCFESLASISEISKVPRSLAWFIIKLYYAAFFAAHGQMRVCGVSCTNLDAVDAVRIYELAKLQGLSGSATKIASGQYMVKFDAHSLTLSFKAIQSGGSHEALWSAYRNFLNGIIDTSPTMIPIQQQRKVVVDKLTAINALLSLKGSNGGNWLSKVRNSVQYRQSHGVWYPYSLGKAVPGPLIHKAVARFKEDPDGFLLATSLAVDSDEVRTFCEGALFLSCLARGTVLDLSARASVKSAIARQGAANLLKLCGMD
jgi:hypothetical protein